MGWSASWVVPEDCAAWQRSRSRGWLRAWRPCPPSSGCPGLPDCSCWGFPTGAGSSCRSIVSATRRTLGGASLLCGVSCGWRAGSGLLVRLASCGFGGIPGSCRLSFWSRRCGLESGRRSVCRDKIGGLSRFVAPGTSCPSDRLAAGLLSRRTLRRGVGDRPATLRTLAMDDSHHDVALGGGDRLDSRVFHVIWAGWIGFVGDAVTQMRAAADMAETALLALLLRGGATGPGPGGLFQRLALVAARGAAHGA